MWHPIKPLDAQAARIGGIFPLRVAIVRQIPNQRPPLLENHSNLQLVFIYFHMVRSMWRMLIWLAYVRIFWYGFIVIFLCSLFPTHR